MPLDGLTTTDNSLYLRAIQVVRERGWGRNQRADLGDKFVCILGALQICLGLPNSIFGGISSIPYDKLEPHAKALGFKSSSEAWLWNDDLDRTQDEVIARLEAAAQP